MNHRDPSCGVNGVTKSNYSVRRTTVIMVRLRLSDGSVFSTNYDNANERTSHLQRRRAKFLHVRPGIAHWSLDRTEGNSIPV